MNNIKSKYQILLNKKNIKPITCLTAYTISIAKIIDGKVDLVLVGDSLGTVLYGMKNTQSVTLQMIKEHGKVVAKNIKKSLCIIDMPFNTYNSKYTALKNAKEIIEYTKCNFLKLETDEQNIEIIKHLTDNGINVVGHIGINPQKFKNFSKIKSVGKTEKENKSLMSQAINLERAGAKFIVLECVKQDLAKKITSAINIPTIGIGSSKYCDGQVVVINDILNIDSSFKKPRFIKQYMNLKKAISDAVDNYAKDVKDKKFPSKKHSYL